MDTLDETLIPGFLDAVTDEDGTVYGAPMRMAVKSLVWVPKPAYADAGYSLEPASIEELSEIADEIKADGTAPWCIGYESGAATGWVGTDWIEEFVLRVAGPEVYDQWVNHEIPFDDPQIKQAFDEYEKLALEDGQRPGRRQGDRVAALRRGRQPVLRGPAGLHAAAPGQLHHRLLPRGRPGQPRRERRRHDPPAARGRVRRTAGARRRRHGRPVQR